MKTAFARTKYLIKNNSQQNSMKCECELLQECDGEYSKPRELKNACRGGDEKSRDVAKSWTTAGRPVGEMQ